MAHVDDGQMRRAGLDTCLAVGCNLDSILRYIGPSAAVVRTTSQPLFTSNVPLLFGSPKSLVLLVMTSAVAPYRRLFREYIRSVCVYDLTGCMSFFSEYVWPLRRDQHRHYGHLALLSQPR